MGKKHKIESFSYRVILIYTVLCYPFSAKTSYMNSGFGYSSNANDFLHQVTVDIGACCGLCTATAACKAFVWNPADKKCYLKNGYGTTTASPTLFYGFPDNTTQLGEIHKVNNFKDD